MVILGLLKAKANGLQRALLLSGRMTRVPSTASTAYFSRSFSKQTTLQSASPSATSSTSAVSPWMSMACTVPME